jgi:DNA repair exonuclease SbcCD ATPase subunit
MIEREAYFMQSSRKEKSSYFRSTFKKMLVVLVYLFLATHLFVPMAWAGAKEEMTKDIAIDYAAGAAGAVAGSPPVPSSNVGAGMGAITYAAKAREAALEGDWEEYDKWRKKALGLRKHMDPYGDYPDGDEEGLQEEQLKALDRQIASTKAQISSLKSRIRALEEALRREREETEGSPGEGLALELEELRRQLKELQNKLTKLEDAHGC